MSDHDTGVTAPDAGVQGGGETASQEAGTGQTQTNDQGPEETRQVPLSALMGVRDELKTYKEKATSLEGQLNNLKMQQRFSQPQPGRGPTQQQQAESDLLESLSDINDDEFVDKKAIAKVVRGLQQRMTQPQGNEEVANLRFELAKVQLSSKDPDYEKTIKTYLPEVAMQNPAIEQTLKAMPTKEQQLMAAHAFAMTNPKYQQAKTGTDNTKETLLDQLDKILNNQSKPKNPAGAGGGGSVVDGADRVASMSSEEFDAFKERVKAGGR